MSLTTTDPIADMLTRIRNAIAVRKDEINLPHSKVKEAIARLLQTTGFIDGVQVLDSTIGKTLVLIINNSQGKTRITEIVRLSKPGRHEYAKAGDIPVVKRGRGVVIVSTSKGMMTGDQARAQGIGGELICRIY